MPELSDLLFGVARLLLFASTLLAAAVITTYHKVARGRSKDERRNHLLPQHAWMQTLAYAGLGAAATLPLSTDWRLALASVSQLLGLASLVAIFRLHAGRRGPHSDVTDRVPEPYRTDPKDWDSLKRRPTNPGS